MTQPLTGPRLSAVLSAALRVRPPNLANMTPSRQCEGNWEFWAEFGVCFLQDTSAKLDDELDKARLADVAHDTKTAAEMMCMRGVAEAAYELERGLLLETDPLGLLQLQAILLDRTNTLLRALTKLSPRLPAELARVDGYFEDLLPAIAPRESICCSKRMPPRGDSAASMISGAACAAAADDDADAYSPTLSGSSACGGAASPGKDGSLRGARVAVVSSDATTRALMQATLLSDRCAAAEVTALDSLDDVAGSGADVVIFHCSARLPFGGDVGSLPRGPSGAIAYVLLGDLPAQVEADIAASGQGWVEVARPPIRRAELIRRIRTVFATSRRDLFPPCPLTPVPEQA